MALPVALAAALRNTQKPLALTIANGLAHNWICFQFLDCECAVDFWLNCLSTHITCSKCTNLIDFGFVSLSLSALPSLPSVRCVCSWSGSGNGCTQSKSELINAQLTPIFAFFLQMAENAISRDCSNFFKRSRQQKVHKQTRNGI